MPHFYLDFGHFWSLLPQSRKKWVKYPALKPCFPVDRLQLTILGPGTYGNQVPGVKEAIFLHRMAISCRIMLDSASKRPKPFWPKSRKKWVKYPALKPCFPVDRLQLTILGPGTYGNQVSGVKKAVFLHRMAISCRNMLNPASKRPKPFWPKSRKKWVKYPALKPCFPVDRLQLTILGPGTYGNQVSGVTEAISYIEWRFLAAFCWTLLLSVPSHFDFGVSLGFGDLWASGY